MPLYEYLCPECGRKTEKLSRNGDAPTEITLCVYCGGTANKILSPCNWSFGWRLTGRSHEVGGPRDEIEKDV